MTFFIHPYITLGFLILAINIPFSYWRANTKKLSLLWFLLIHLPVPMVIYLRTFFEIDLSIATIPLLFSTYFAGQYFGKKLKESILIQKQIQIDSSKY